MGRKILIVDDDPWIARMVKTMMESRGYTVDTAKEGQEGLEKAFSFLPDLIITDVLMPNMNGWSFVRALRSHEEMALVPVIFLTGLNSDEDRILGFRLGADDYLPKPFRFEELYLRVEKALRNSLRMRAQVKSMGQGEVEQADLNGDLSQLGVSSILTFLSIEGKSGVLTLKGLATGRVFLKSGQPMAASIEGRVNFKGADVIYEMLTWRAGKFSFSALEVDMDDQIDMSTTHLLLEGARRIDETNAPD